MKNIQLAVLALILGAAAPARAQFSPQVTANPGSVPSGINYQGRLEQSGSPVTGSKQMVFRVYDAVAGGNQRWAGAAQTVAVSLGLFNASVPVPISALVGGGARYLEVEVDGTILSPRELLNSVPYAMVAKSVEGTFDISTAGLSIMPNPQTSTPALFISSVTGAVDLGGPTVTIGGSTMVITGGMVGVGMTPTAATLEVTGTAAGPSAAIFHGNTGVAGAPGSAVSAAGAATCFLAGTLIATPSGQRPIEALRPGDEVLSYDVASGRRITVKVLNAFHRASDHHYVLDGGLRVTGEHPFWANGSWVKVKDLTPGASLFNGDGPVALAGKRYVPGVVEVYNIEVDVTHTYFAGGLLVHNKGLSGHSIGLNATAGAASGAGGRSWAIYAATTTGSANSYAAFFGGNVGLGVENPASILDIGGDNAYINIAPGAAAQSIGVNLAGLANSSSLFLDDAAGRLEVASSLDIKLTAPGAVSVTNDLLVAGSTFSVGVTTLVVTSGMVGIGITPTTGPLEVYAAGGTAATFGGPSGSANSPGVAVLAGTSGSCFLAGTPIATPGGSRPIESLRPGDEVLSYDVATGRKTTAKVLNAFRRASDHHYVLDGRLRVTGEHPFWANGAWVEVKDLNPGMSLFDGVTAVAMTGKRYVPGEVEVYNIEVDVTHTYFAGGLLVHNKGAGVHSIGLKAVAHPLFSVGGRSWAIHATTTPANDGQAGIPYAAYFGGNVGFGNPYPANTLDILADNAWINIAPMGAGQYMGIGFTGLGGANAGGIYTDDTSGTTEIYGNGDINLAPINNVKIKSGTNELFRCTVAGALPIGALTINTASCGTGLPADSVTTGLFLP